MAGCWCPAPLLFLAFMGLQGRYFGRWLLPIFPILCLLAAFFALWLVRRSFAGEQASRTASGRAARGAGVCRREPRRARAPDRRRALLVVALLAQGLVYSVHSGLVLSRADTRNLTRAWMVAHVPKGTLIVAEPVSPDEWAREVERRDGDRGQSLPLAEVPSLLSRISADGALEPSSQPTARSRDRGLRAHAQPRADRLLRAQRLLLGGERHHPVRARVRRPAGGAAGDRLLRGAGQAGRSRLPRLALLARRGRVRVRLRLEL